MTALYFVLLMLASICFVASTLGATLRQLNFVSLGLFFWVLVPLIVSFKSLVH